MIDLSVVRFPDSAWATAAGVALIAVTPILVLVALRFICIGLLHYWLPGKPGYREWYRIVRAGAQLQAERERRHWHRRHNGLPYYTWVQLAPTWTDRLGLTARRLQRVGPPRVEPIRFAGAIDAPLELRELMNSFGFIRNAHGEWVRMYRAEPPASAPEPTIEYIGRFT